MRDAQDSRAAIASLVSPSATSSSTSRSRALRSPRGCGAAAGSASREERPDLAQEPCQAGSSSSRMWFALQRDEARRPGCSAASSRPSSNGTAASSRACSHQRRRRTREASRRPRSPLAPREPRRDLRRGRDAAAARRTTPSAPGVPSGRNSVREEAPERRVIASPIRRGSLDASPRVRARLATATVPAARVAAVEDEAADALGMPHGVGDRDRRALRHAEQGEAVDARRVDDRLEVGDPALAPRARRRSRSESPQPRSS